MIMIIIIFLSCFTGIRHAMQLLSL